MLFSRGRIKNSAFIGNSNIIAVINVGIVDDHPFKEDAKELINSLYQWAVDNGRMTGRPDHSTYSLMKEIALNTEMDKYSFDLIFSCLDKSELMERKEYISYLSQEKLRFEKSNSSIEFCPSI